MGALDRMVRYLREESREEGRGHSVTSATHDATRDTGHEISRVPCLVCPMSHSRSNHCSPVRFLAVPYAMEEPCRSAIQSSSNSGQPRSTRSASSWALLLMLPNGRSRRLYQ